MRDRGPTTTQPAPRTAPFAGRDDRLRGTRDDMGPLLLAACATVALIEVAGLARPERGFPLAIIAAFLAAMLVASGALWAAATWRTEREAMRLRDAERRAESARAERLTSIAHELGRQDRESAIHRLLIAQAGLVVEHDESDLVVFPQDAERARARAVAGLAIEPSALEQRVAETGAAAHRATLERGRPCYQVAMPVLAADGLLAVLTLRRALGSFTAAELDAAMSLCAQVGAALQRTRMSLPASRGTLLS